MFLLSVLDEKNIQNGRAEKIDEDDNKYIGQISGKGIEGDEIRN